MGKNTAAGKRDGVECCEWRNRIGCFIRLRRTEETVTKEMEEQPSRDWRTPSCLRGSLSFLLKRKKDIYLASSKH